MVLKQRYQQQTVLSPTPQRYRGNGGGGGGVSLPYGSAASPKNAGDEPASSVYSSNTRSKSVNDVSSAVLSPGARPLSPTFFEQTSGQTTNAPTTRAKRMFFSESSRSCSPKDRRSSLVWKKQNYLTYLYCLTVLVAGYFIVTTSSQLRSREEQLKQMKSNYHVLHHKVRETDTALQNANKVNHNMEDKSRKLEKTNSKLKIELEEAKKGSMINPKLLTSSDGEDMSDMAEDEVTLLLMRRQEAMKSRISRLQSEIQEISKREAAERFGDGPHKVRITVAFENGKRKNDDRKRETGTFIVELAPLDKMAHSVHLFLQMAAHKLWDDTVFLHTTHHVLQAAPIEFRTGRSKRDDFKNAKLDQLSFQEYSDDFPHEKYTIGFGGRPGGPDFYISTIDNTEHHGPGGQGHHDLHEEADPCFGRVIEGTKVVDRMHRRSVRTVGVDGEGWDGKDVPITSILTVEII